MPIIDITPEGQEYIEALEFDDNLQQDLDHSSKGLLLHLDNVGSIKINRLSELDVSSSQFKKLLNRRFISLDLGDGVELNPVEWNPDTDDYMTKGGHYRL